MSERRYAILIASSKYACDPKRLPELRCPENDVEALGNILTSEQHGLFDRPDVLALKNKPSYEVLRALNRVLKQAGKSDLVLIYYSGHGKLDPAGRLHLATSDTLIEELESTSVPVSSVRNYIDISPSNRVILILDCCYSGSVGSAFLKGSVDDQLQQVSDARGIYIITASTAIQVAQERTEDEYSLLTRHLLEGIEEGRADADDDGKITVDDLYSYAYERMKKESFQVPMKWGLNVRGEELVLARTGRLAGAGRLEEDARLYNRRREFRDSYGMSVMTLGGAIGAGLGLGLQRGLSALFLPTPLVGVRFAMYFFWGALLGGSLAFGLALAGYLRRQAYEAVGKPSGWRALVKKFRRQEWLAVPLGALFFGLTHLLVALFGGLSLLAEPGVLLMTMLMGFVAGLGLSAALFLPSPLKRAGRTGAWSFRLGLAALTLALVQLAFILAADKGAGLAIAWGSDFYHSNFIGNETPRWQQVLSFRLKWYEYMSIIDAALSGIVITLGVTLGMSRAAASLKRSDPVFEEVPH